MTNLHALSRGPHRVLSTSTGTDPAPLPLHRSDAARLIEQQAAAPLPPHTLMQRAGLGVARLAAALRPHAQRVWIVAGPGNNGGDGFEAALHLAAQQRQVRISWLGTPEKLPADAAMSLARAQQIGAAGGIDITPELTPPDGWSEADLAIDALLGRGLARPAEGLLADAIAALNRQPAPVLAVDLPSGLPGDTGAPQPGAPVVQAHWTLALLSLAPGLFTAQGRDACGEIWWDDLGIDSGSAGMPAPAAWLGSAAALGWPQRRHAQHKGSFGDVRVVAGARSMGGAALLAARAALQAGAGRVYLHRLDPKAEALDPVSPELMHASSLPKPASHDSAADRDPLAQCTVVAGCGGGGAIAALLPELLQRTRQLVLDADGLNAVAAEPGWHELLRQRAAHGAVTILTPHPLEAARLLGSSAAQVQADRLAAAEALAQRFQALVLLKGSGSVLAAPGRAPWINPSGNAALATPGSGDVLAGWLGGLWSQLSAEAGDGFDSAWLALRCAAWSHGRAAEVASPHGLAWPAGALLETLRSFAPAAG